MSELPAPNKECAAKLMNALLTTLYTWLKERSRMADLKPKQLAVEELNALAAVLAPVLQGTNWNMGATQFFLRALSTNIKGQGGPDIEFLAGYAVDVVEEHPPKGELN